MEFGSKCDQRAMSALAPPEAVIAKMGFQGLKKFEKRGG